MNTISNTNPSFKGIIVITFVAISTFLIFMLSFDYFDNYKIISHKSRIEKIKVKIDSLVISSTRSGKSSSSTSTNYFYNGGLFLAVQDTKGFLLKYENPTEKIYDYMSHHNDSLNLWVLNKVAVKFANDKEKQIDVSIEIENNKRIIFYFLFYIISLVIVKLNFKKQRNYSG